jgi:hypothetical protein
MWSIIKRDKNFLPRHSPYQRREDQFVEYSGVQEHLYRFFLQFLFLPLEGKEISADRCD